MRCISTSLIRDGDVSSNVALQPGDILIIPAAPVLTMRMHSAARAKGGSRTWSDRSRSFSARLSGSCRSSGAFDEFAQIASDADRPDAVAAKMARRRHRLADLHRGLDRGRVHSDKIRIVGARLSERRPAADAAVAWLGGGHRPDAAPRFPPAHAVEPAQSGTARPFDRSRCRGHDAGAKRKPVQALGERRRHHRDHPQPDDHRLSQQRPADRQKRGAIAADDLCREDGGQQPHRDGQRAALSRRRDRLLPRSIARRREAAGGIGAAIPGHRFRPSPGCAGLRERQPKPARSGARRGGQGQEPTRRRDDAARLAAQRDRLGPAIAERRSRAANRRRGRGCPQPGSEPPAAAARQSRHAAPEIYRSAPRRDRRTRGNPAARERNQARRVGLGGRRRPAKPRSRTPSTTSSRSSWSMPRAKSPRRSALSPRLRPSRIGSRKSPGRLRP